MKEYKSSRYNLFMDFDNGSFQHVVSNTFSGTIMFADQDLTSLLQRFDTIAFRELKKRDPPLFAYLLEMALLLRRLSMN